MGDKTSEKEDATTPEPQGAPEKYADFKLPEGYEFDPAARTAFESTARKHNLSQDAAQELVNIWSEHAAKSAQAPYDLWATTQRDWHGKIFERFGGEEGAAKVSAQINKAIDNVLPPGLRVAFRSALDLTGAGSNPDLFEGLSILLKPHMEGTPVKGGTPTKEGTTEPNTPRGPIDPAAAMYPHLVKNRPQ